MSAHRFHLPLLAAMSALLAVTAQSQVTRSAPTSLPPTGGRYSHIVSTDLPPGSRLVVIAGQVGADSTGRVIPGDAAAQIRLAYDNLDRALQAAGATWDDVVKTTTILSRAADIATLRDVRAARFANRTVPANTLLVVQALYDPAVMFEVEAMAVVRPR